MLFPEKIGRCSKNRTSKTRYENKISYQWTKCTKDATEIEDYSNNYAILWTQHSNSPRIACHNKEICHTTLLLAMVVV
jgi:hypothetical protein